jgi:hypothetical protein
MSKERRTSDVPVIPALEQNEIVPQLGEERVFYSSLSAALLPYVGSEHSVQIAQLQTVESGSRSERANVPVVPAREQERFIEHLTTEQAEQRALGIDSKADAQTIKIIQPPKTRTIAVFQAQPSDAELRALQKYFVWTGEQQLFRNVVVDEDGHQKIVLLSSREITLYGVPVTRIERYEEVGDPGNPDFKLTYQYYRKVREGIEANSEPVIGSNIQIVDKGNTRITKITREVEGGREIVFCSLTNRTTGHTVVINDIHPEFIVLEAGKKVEGNSIDNPQLYLPQDWPRNQKDIRKLGERFGYIDMFYEAYASGGEAFANWWKHDKSMGSMLTTGNVGRNILTLFTVGGIGDAMFDHDNRRRIAAGTIATMSALSLEVGHRVYGRGYQAIVDEQERRGEEFVKMLAAHEVLLQK